MSPDSPRREVGSDFWKTVLAVVMAALGILGFVVALFNSLRQDIRDVDRKLEEKFKTVQDLLLEVQDLKNKNENMKDFLRRWSGEEFDAFCQASRGHYDGQECQFNDGRPPIRYRPIDLK